MLNKIEETVKLQILDSGDSGAVAPLPAAQMTWLIGRRSALPRLMIDMAMRIGPGSGTEKGREAKGSNRGVGREG